MAKHRYTKEQDKFLKDNVKGISLKELHKRFNNSFNLNLSESAIMNRKKRLNLKSGIAGGRFEKGHQPYNKGRKWDEYMSKQSQINASKTTFKKGHIPVNHREIGSERVNVSGYIEIKIKEPNKWELKHRHIYKKAYGEIPKGYKLIFADGNKLNLSLDNLLLVANSEELIMNRKKMFSKNGEITKTGVLIAKVIDKSNKHKKRKKK